LPNGKYGLRALSLFSALAIVILLIAQSLAQPFDPSEPASAALGDENGPAGAQETPLGQASEPDKPPKECKTELGCGEDLAAALDFESKVLDNFWFGQVFDIQYATAERIPGNVVSVHNFADSALWTGTYLAAESYRYALAKKYVHKKKLTDEERLFWQGQMADAKNRVDQMVAKYHILTNISENWNHEFALSTRTGFGGGIFNGEKGYLMRACIPAGVPAWQKWTDLEAGDPDGAGPFTGNFRVFGPLTWNNADGTTTEYFCEDATSRDAYAGTTFGLLTAFDLVSVDDAVMRTTIRDDIITLVDFATKYYWNTPRPHGRISLPLNSNRNNSPCKEINAVFHSCGHDFENFISPLFVQVPMARLNMAKAAQHVAHAASGREDVAKWDAVYAEELATQVPVLALSMEVDAVQPNEGYFKYNLHHLTGFNITRLEENVALNTSFKQAFGVMDRTTGDDVNSHFETITFALTGETDRLTAAVQHLREWRQYRSRIDLGGATSNSANCGTSIECVPRDQLEVTQETPAGDTNVVVPGPSEIQSQIPGQPKPQLRSRYPLPVALRPPTDFLWQRPPTQLDGGTSATSQSPGVDYLLPYWMIRYYTEVEEPPLSPFPAWSGPAHS
jgi:hypothetical protein